MHCNLQSSDNLRSLNRRRGPKASVMILAGAIALMLAACSAGASGDPGPTNTAIGQPVKLGGAEFTVWSVSAHSYVGQPSQPARAKDGGVLIVVRYELHNVGSKPMAAASARQVALIDPQGALLAPDPDLTKAYLSASAIKDEPAEVAPDARVKQARVFDPPASSYPHGWAIAIGDKTHRVELQ